MIELIGVCLFEWLWCMTNLIMKPRMFSYNKGFQLEAFSGKFDLNHYNATKKRSFHLKSNFGYILSCELLEPEPEPQYKTTSAPKIAILCHGLGYAKYGCLKYTEIFLKLGYYVFVYDQRNHGLSGKALTTMGYYEKYDLMRVVDWCFENYGPNCKIITHGESMGAATVLLHLGIDSRVKCTIADCAYSDLKELLVHQMKQFYHLPKCVIYLGSMMTFLRAGFWYKQVSPIKVVSETDTPILFIHGKKDNFVPASMSKQMYACKKDKKAIYLVADARHAESCCINRKGYQERVEEFLKKYMD